MDYMIRCFVRWLKFWFSLFSKSMLPQKSLRKCLPLQKSEQKNVHRYMVNPCNLQFSLQNIYIRCIYLIVAWRSFHLIFRSTCVCVVFIVQHFRRTAQLHHNKQSATISHSLFPLLFFPRQILSAFRSSWSNTGCIFYSHFIIKMRHFL